MTFEKTPPKRDTVNPKKLLEFMMTDWKPQTSELPAPHPHAAVFAARRQALAAKFPGETLIIPTGHEVTRANDTHFRFRPGSDFFWLTGNLEPDCVLVVTRDGESLRFRGFLCRKSVAMSPYRVRLERLSSDGQVLGAATGRVSGLSGRGHRCTVYTVTAPWRLEPGDRVRACAQRGDGPCPAAG